MAEDPEGAEALLREALTADVFYGPAHNNLGVLHLERGELYEAANEFEWARKLMPGHPDPRINLGLSFERAGRWDEAIQSFRAALEVYPGHRPATQGLAAALVKTGKQGPELHGLLTTLSVEGETPEWRDWARRQLQR